MLCMGLIYTQAVMADITVNPSNVVASAENGFNYGGGLGISLLTVACVLGAIMFGWRLKRGGR